MASHAPQRDTEVLDNPSSGKLDSDVGGLAQNAKDLRLDHPTQKDAKNYMRWDAKGVDVVQPGEEETIKAVSAQFSRLQMLNFNEHHHCYRATHLKTQGCVKGTLTIRDDLPEYLKQGMFAQSGKHDAIMRYSSLTPKLLPDTAGASRGVGLKVFGVKGDKIWCQDDEDKETQDFTFNNAALLELRDPKTTNEIVDSLERNWNDGDKFVEELKAREDAEVACYPASLKQEHMAAMDQFSQSAYRYGDYVAKFGLFPVTEEQKKLKSWAVQSSDLPNVLATSLAEVHAKTTVKYSFCVQLLENLKEQPVDDIGIIWDAEKYPFQEVAILEFPPQDSWNHAFRNYWDDRLTVNTWHGLKTHQPLGSTNRMRRTVYMESRKLRMKVNATSCIEPGSVKELPI